MRRLCIVESPYAGDVEANLSYARKACRDSYDRGEQPFASHLLYPQFLDDQQPDERRDGIAFGYHFWQPSGIVAWYCDNGWSGGMIAALERAVERYQHIEFQARWIYPGDRIIPVEKFNAETQQYLLSCGLQVG